VKQLFVRAELFFRDRKRLFLSPAGRSLLVYAERLLRLSEEARDAVSGSMPRGIIRLGALFGVD
jgi:DNA-binding transcriptional LysR family regulator